MLYIIYMWLSGVPIPIGYNQYPCPKEYQIKEIICIIKEDREK